MNNRNNSNEEIDRANERRSLVGYLREMFARDSENEVVNTNNTQRQVTVISNTSTRNYVLPINNSSSSSRVRREENLQQQEEEPQLSREVLLQVWNRMQNLSSEQRSLVINSMSGTTNTNTNQNRNINLQEESNSEVSVDEEENEEESSKK
jgi:nucleotidyltransferase/DNA polymerase involved in DNA repair